MDIVFVTLSIAVAVALGLAVYNYMTLSSMKRAVGVHNTILDLAEFQNLNPAIKDYYMNLVRDVMPEVMDYANIVWTSAPQRPDPAMTKSLAASLRARKPAFKTMVENRFKQPMMLPSMPVMPVMPTMKKK